MKPKALALVNAILSLALTLSPLSALAAEDHKGHHPQGAQSVQVHKGTGMIKSIDIKGNKLNLFHEPIASLKWPAMTMDLPVADGKLLFSAKPGMKVEFDLQAGKNGQYVITAIRPLN